MRVAILLPALLWLPGAQAQESREYYVYQRAVAPSPLHADAEFATGTREAGVFGRRGVEGLVRMGLTLDDRWTLEGTFGAVQDNDTDERATGWSIEGRYGLLPSDADWGLALGGGYRRDYNGVDIPFVRLLGERALQRWNLAASTLVEFPHSNESDPAQGRRDAADLIVSVGTSYAVSQGARVGIELAAEDLEGFFDEAEAEGGAKLVLGPTLHWRMWDGQVTRWNLGWVYAATANAPANPEATDYRGRRNGLLARVAFGFGR